MSDTVIQVQDLSKRYIINHQRNTVGGGSGTLREAITDGMDSLMGRLRKGGRQSSQDSHEEFWALKDLSFDLHRGEVLGVIGRNGAGKSTLLKLLSRITEPTQGSIRLRGRVGSLLEVGTGFHPELTGRENIFLNGAILGMSNVEIRKRFDEIVAFAEVEKFLDTPVKRYSSGMYVRLAFAVAAHLEPEILIIDEVLAVGDTEFQKKCLGKMGEVARGGRTVLFVSHNIASISNLCSHCLVLNRGQRQFFGPSAEGVAFYLDSLNKISPDGAISDYRPTWAQPYIVSARILDSNEKVTDSFTLGSNITVEMVLDTGDLPPLSDPIMGVIINHATQGTVGGINMRMTGDHMDGEPVKRCMLRCTMKSTPLLQGQYSLDLWLGNGPADIDSIAGYLRFQMVESDIYGAGKTPFAHMGVIYFNADWDGCRLDDTDIADDSAAAEQTET